jgi:hypothetical protein
MQILKQMDSYIVDCETNASMKANSNVLAEPLITVKGLQEANKKICEGGPDSSVESKCEQLQLHNRLHELYESGRLRKNLLSFYLHHAKIYRENLLKYFTDPQDPTLPENFENSICPARLAKFPPGWIILADRGFANDSYMYPNLNHHITPHFLSGRPQFTTREISTDRVTCEHRYTCEVVFSRFTDIKCLRDVVPYQFNHILTDAVHCGLANNNMQQPLKKPVGYDEYIQGC